MDRDFLTERITKTKLLIVTYEDAILALASNSVQMYSLDTGQNRQTVTKIDITNLQGSLNGLYNRLTMLQTRLTGSGVVRGVPAW